MEALLKFLPARPQPIVVRYGASAALVLVSFAFRLGAGPAAGEYSFIFFIPPILAASVLFDRGSGFVATALSAALVGALLNWRVGALNHIAALTLFICVSLFVVIVGEGMRKALEKSAAAGDELQLAAWANDACRDRSWLPHHDCYSGGRMKDAVLWPLCHVGQETMRAAVN